MVRDPADDPGAGRPGDEFRPAGVPDGDDADIDDADTAAQPGPSSSSDAPTGPGRGVRGPRTREHPFNALAERFPRENITPITHFYRGELARSLAWRQKMDMTTHWAIITATALISVSFSTPGTSHIILLFASALIFLLLHIEGRRYRFFDVWRTRLRMLEVHFIVPAIAYEHRLPEGNWRETLCNDLFKPTYKISYWEAVGRRLHRNYIWLFALTFLAWIGKVQMHGAHSGKSWYEAFAVTGLGGGFVTIPAWFTITVACGFHLAIATLYVYGMRSRQATGEIRRKDPRQRVWPI